ncbi:hypothetical protein QTP86_015740 [Hemibagrus guttatus]|nr:hypothetical protein QTP86_015740 [Hemibagrus guttatus]
MPGEDKEEKKSDWEHPPPTEVRRRTPRRNGSGAMSPTGNRSGAMNPYKKGKKIFRLETPPGQEEESSVPQIIYLALWTLWICADQLAQVFTDIFNLSLAQAIVPTCLKTTTVIPVPNHYSTVCLNDFCPDALTPIVMKCFEKLVLSHLIASRFHCSSSSSNPSG